VAAGDEARVAITGGPELTGTIREAEELADGGKRIVVAAEKPEAAVEPGAEATVKLSPKQ
jgi:hypothetical protein